MRYRVKLSPVLALVSLAAIAIASWLWLRKADTTIVPIARALDGGAPRSVATRWRLVTTTCPFMPGEVALRRDGNRLESHADGIPDSSGTIDADGNFEMGNALGRCTGRQLGKTSTERCDLTLLRCTAEYRLLD